MRPTLDRPERQKPPGSLPAAALPAMLLRGFVHSRLVAFAPGAGDLDPGLLGQRADEAPDGVLLPTCGVHNLLQCGAAGADQEVAHDRLIAELAWYPRRAGVRGGRGRAGCGLGSLGSLGLLRGLGGRLWWPVSAALQWGRDVSIPEIFTSFSSRSEYLMLQWGRDVSIPEIGLGVRPLGRGRTASMGPGCFYPGNARRLAAL